LPTVFYSVILDTHQPTGIFIFNNILWYKLRLIRMVENTPDKLRQDFYRFITLLTLTCNDRMLFKGASPKFESVLNNCSAYGKTVFYASKVDRLEEALYVFGIPLCPLPLCKLAAYSKIFS
jgi:hypothetical protein